MLSLTHSYFWEWKREPCLSPLHNIEFSLHGLNLPNFPFRLMQPKREESCIFPVAFVNTELIGCVPFCLPLCQLIVSIATFKSNANFDLNRLISTSNGKAVWVNLDFFLRRCKEFSWNNGRVSFSFYLCLPWFTAGKKMDQEKC